MEGTAHAGPSRITVAWLALVGALALHVLDEALTGFLAVYNPTAAVLRQRLQSGFPPALEFTEWLTRLVIAVILLALLTPLATRALRIPAAIFAVLMVLNGIAHTLGTIAGRTVAEVTFPRPMPGFYSSPFLIAAAVWFLHELRRRD